MQLRTAVSLLVPALAILGCASQKTLDSQTQSVNQQLEELRQSHAALSGAQQRLETRLAKLEGESAIHASRLNQMAPAGEELKRELDGLRAQGTTTQSALSALSGKIEAQAAAVAEAKETAEDAVKIARDSRLVAGKIVDSLTLTQDMVLYNYEQPELTARGREAMDTLIAGVKPLMPHAFIEIIGFSDDFSLGSQNRQIALERAESVRRYLHEVGGIPLHRMSTISYGDLKPLASNTSMEGRSQNRRVIVQVLK
jgi:outer membrane protein OmpA-like peptidoglycan-associated protein